MSDRTLAAHPPGVIRTSPVFDVAICGCGPTGATLAGLLGRAGLRVLVLDKAATVHPQPRAVGFDQDAMRIFQCMGVAQELAAHVAPFRDAVYLGPGGHVIQRVAHVPAPWPLAWRPNYSCDQPGVEETLRAALRQMPGVTLALGQELTEAHDDGDHVQLGSRSADDPTQPARAYTARWLVACDGASSPLRRMRGIGLKSLDYDVPWIVVDMLVDPAWLGTLPDTNVQYCDPARPSTHVVCPGQHRRWEFMMLEGERPDQAITPAHLWQLLAPWLKPGQATIWRAAAYRFHALIARQWRSGRMLLAGDSAHQTPPFMGQGMCQGIRDAGNLAWKLAMVVRGQAPESLLDTYEAERAPHVEATTELARKLGVLISERDPQRARERDAALLASGGGQAPLIVRQSMIPGLRAGLVASGQPLAGAVFPQPWVVPVTGGPRMLDDLTGPAVRIVVSARASAADLASITRAASQAGWPVVVVHAAAPGAGAADAPDAYPPPPAPPPPSPPPSPPHHADVIAAREAQPVLLPWLREARCLGAVVRPDHYVYGAFRDAAGAIQLLHQLAQSITEAASQPRNDLRRQA